MNSKNSSKGSPKSPEGAQKPSPERVLVFGWFLGIFAIAYYRALGGIPQDMSAYFAAADVIEQGLSPYREISKSPTYDGFPYVYFPGLHPLTEAIFGAPKQVLVGIDSVLRGGLAAFSIWAIAKKLEQVPPWPLLVLGLAFFDPYITDFFVGNLSTYMFAIFAFVLWTGGQERRFRNKAVELFVGVVLGVLLMFKPFWGIATAWVAATSKRWELVFGLLIGALGTLACGWIFYASEIEPWRELVQSIRVYWTSFDLGTASPWLVLPGALAWGVGAWHVRKRPDAWVWASATLLFWPRLGFYSYLLVIPLLLWAIKKFGRKALLLALPFTVALTLPLHAYTVLKLAIFYGFCLLLSGLWLLRPPDVAPQQTLDTKS